MSLVNVAEINLRINYPSWYFQCIKFCTLYKDELGWSKSDRNFATLTEAKFDCFKLSIGNCSWESEYELILRISNHLMSWESWGVMLGKFMIGLGWISCSQMAAPVMPSCASPWFLEILLCRLVFLPLNGYSMVLCSVWHHVRVPLILLLLCPCVNWMPCLVFYPSYHNSIIILLNTG